MDYPLTKRSSCCVCGLDTFRHTHTFRHKGWFLVGENRWVNRLRILPWHSSLAAQKDMRSFCCRQHLKTLIGHWLNQASLRLPSSHDPPLPIRSDPNLADVHLGPGAVGCLLGELAVHRESFSRVWSGPAATLETIVDVLITIGDENETHALEFHLSDQPRSTDRLSLQ
ncbi:MAG TPA: hypothetical protein VIH78_13940 [Terriglobales bacterium]